MQILHIVLWHGLTTLAVIRPRGEVILQEVQQDLLGRRDVILQHITLVAHTDLKTIAWCGLKNTAFKG